MDSWTNQLGFPLIKLRRHGNMIHATQQYFLAVNSSAKVNTTRKWYVPLSYTTSTNPEVENQIWMHGKDGDKAILSFKCFRF